MNLIDKSVEDLCLELGIEGTVIDDNERYVVDLVKGTGVTVYTSPAKARFWSLASQAVSIFLLPDEKEYKERLDVPEWCAYRYFPNDIAKKLIQRKGPPKRGQLVEPWAEWQSRIDDLRGKVASAHPIQKGEVVNIYEPSRYDGRELEELHSLDWEWIRGKPEDSIGLAISTLESNVYLPVRASDIVFHDSEQQAARTIFSNSLKTKVPVVLHGGRADIGTQYLGDPIELFGYPIDDTLLMAYVLDPNTPDLGLKALAPSLLRKRAIPNPGDVETLPVSEAASYAGGSDTKLTLELFTHLKSKLIEANLYDVYRNIERPLVPVVSSMEKVGIPVDIQGVLAEYKSHAAIEMGARRFFLENYGEVRTPAHARQSLARLLGHDPGTTDQRELSKYREGEMDVYFLYTTTRTRRRSFLGRILKEWSAAGKPDPFYLHPRFNQAGSIEDYSSSSKRAPRTGRFSSSDPNFQQQPRSLRHIYIPPPGCYWWKWDYGQLELRLAANASLDKNLIADINSGQPHRKFQAQIQEQVGTGVDYYAAKTANFEKLYFGGDRQLVRVLQKDRVFIDLALARQIGKAHANRYSEYYIYGQNYVDRCKKQGYVAFTPMGRARYIGELRSSDPEVYSHGTRAAVNMSLQGWAADIVKLTMARIVPILNNYGGHLALTVHDELCGWVPKDVNIEKFKKEMVEAMTDWNLGPVPLVVEGGVGSSWAGPFS